MNFCGVLTFNKIDIMNYYKEKVVKDTKERAEYLTSVEDFCLENKKIADKKREKFISPDKYFKNSEFYRREYVKLLGFPLTGKKGVAKLIRKDFVTTDKNVNIYRMQFEVSGIKFYGIYFEQIENKCDKPFSLCFHGGDGTPELISSIHLDSANYNHLARRVTDIGFSVFCPQLLLWSKDTYGNAYDRKIIDGKLRQLGGSITALEVFLTNAVLDYFINKEKVNKDKLFSIGLSYGGMYALTYTALDTRIKACFSSSWFNDRFKISWSDWCYLNASEKFLDAELVALICPRPLFISLGDKDELFDYKLSEKEAEKVKKYYTKFKKSENFVFDVFSGNHEADKSDKWIKFLIENE